MGFFFQEPDVDLGRLYHTWIKSGSHILEQKQLISQMDYLCLNCPFLLLLVMG